MFGNAAGTKLTCARAILICGAFKNTQRVQRGLNDCFIYTRESLSTIHLSALSQHLWMESEAVARGVFLFLSPCATFNRRLFCALVRPRADNSVRPLSTIRPHAPPFTRVILSLGSGGVLFPTHTKTVTLSYCERS